MGLLAQTAEPAKEVLGVERIAVVADRGYFKIEDIVRKPGPIHSGGGCVAPVFRYLLLPGWDWLVGAPGQFVAQLLEQSLHAMRLDGLERDPIAGLRKEGMPEE
jgi:hypothetical protein